MLSDEGSSFTFTFTTNVQGCIFKNVKRGQVHIFDINFQKCYCASRSNVHLIQTVFPLIVYSAPQNNRLLENLAQNFLK